MHRDFVALTLFTFVCLVAWLTTPTLPVFGQSALADIQMPTALHPTPIAETSDGKPDMIITEFSWTPKLPQIGDEVHFQVTIKNIGTATTPAGVTTGVAFGVGHTNPILWSDTYKKAIAPGETVTLTPNDGADGKTTWTATSGFHDGIWAIVDDAHRYPESDYINNMCLRPFAVHGSGPVPARYTIPKPDLVITDFHWLPKHPKLGDRITVEVTVKNQGSAPTPAGKTLGVGFYILYYNDAVLYTNTDQKPLAPGQSVTLRTNGGTFGSPWAAPEGSYRLTADVNDTGAIDESDVENNFFEKTLTVTNPAGRSKILAGLTKLTGTVFGHTASPEGNWLAFGNAFDGDVGTCCMSDPIPDMSVGLDLGAAGSAPVRAIRFYPKPYEEADMIGGEFQGSNTSQDSGYTTLYHISQKPASNWNVVPLTNSQPYRYLRYRAADKSKCLINEIEFYTHKADSK